MSLAIPKGVKPKRNKPKRLEDRGHLEFVSEMACCCCGQMPVQVHHLLRTGEHGMSKKSGDNHVIPLCSTCHRNLHSDGNEVRFLSIFCVDGMSLAAKLWEEYQCQKVK